MSRYRFVIATLLFLAGVINFMDRASIGILAPNIKASLSLDNGQLGMVFSAFFIGYAIFSYLGGYFSDRFGPVKTFGVAGFAWSLACGMTGLAGGFVQLLIVRVIFGCAEGPMSSTTNRSISNWFPRSETARAVGFTFSGQTLGSAIAAPLVTYAAIGFGWRAAFAVLTVLGLCWSIAWLLMATDRPQQHRRVSAAELAHIEAGQTAAIAVRESGRPISFYLKQPSVLSLGAALFALNYTIYIFISWLPSYLIHTMHVATRELAITAMIPWIGGFAGYVGGGFVSDQVYKGMRDKLSARRITTVVPLLLTGVSLLLLPLVSTVTEAVVILSCALMMLAMSTQSLWATIHEIVPKSRIGGVGGFIHFLANTSGVLSPALTGFAIQRFGGYSSAFVLAAVIAFIGGTSVIFLVRQIVDDAPLELQTRGLSPQQETR